MQAPPLLWRAFHIYLYKLSCPPKRVSINSSLIFVCQDDLGELVNNSVAQGAGCTRTHHHCGTATKVGMVRHVKCKKKCRSSHQKKMLWANPKKDSPTKGVPLLMGPAHFGLLAHLGDAGRLRWVISSVAQGRPYCMHACTLLVESMQGHNNFVQCASRPGIVFIECR